MLEFLEMVGYMGGMNDSRLPLVEEAQKVVFVCEISQV